MATNYADLWKKASDLEKEGANVANFSADVAKLPYALKDEFRKRQDPALDKEINKAQQKVFGGAIEGLDMYQDISNPFTRRALAEKYQGGLSEDYQNLSDERTRRQGVYADYIDKWAGLYGAEAARQSDLFQNKISAWDREKNLADTEEDNRRWEITNARASASANNKPYTEQEIIATINTLKNNGKNWDEINKFLNEQGVDTVHNSFGDIQLRSAFGEPTEDRDPLKEAQIKKAEYENKIVEDYNKKTTAPNVYEKDGSYYKKRGLFGLTNILDYLYPDKKIQ